MKNHKALISMMALSFLAIGNACGSDKKQEDGAEEKGKTVVAAEPSKITEVTAEELTIRDFNHEVVSNGKAAGHNNAELYFPAGGDAVITSVYVKNGDHVSKGQKLATLDTYKLVKERESAATALAKAELDLKDALIGQGYDPDASSGIPAEVMKLARLRSGYTEAEASLAKAEHEIEQATLTAPFSGVIANLSGKVFNRPDASKPFCSVIGDGMDVEFKIMEGELAVLQRGDKVQITPFSTGGVYSGRVSEINPQVDENGMVTLVASVDRGKGLYDGMNVKVSVQKSLGKQLVVPKTAVVLRTGRQVVFTLNEKGDKAMWNYVETGLENMGHYTITDGLEPGMKVITTGNVNLAHEAPVKVISH